MPVTKMQVQESLKTFVDKKVLKFFQETEDMGIDIFDILVRDVNRGLESVNFKQSPEAPNVEYIAATKEEIEHFYIHSLFAQLLSRYFGECVLPEDPDCDPVVKPLLPKQTEMLQVSKTQIQQYFEDVLGKENTKLFDKNGGIDLLIKEVVDFLNPIDVKYFRGLSPHSVVEYTNVPKKILLQLVLKAAVGSAISALVKKQEKIC